MNYTDLIKSYRPTETTTFAVLMYGHSGSGKTTLAGTWPKPFFIDADRGMRALNQTLPYLQLKDSKVPFTLVLNVLQDALIKAGPWAPGGPLASVETIVIDSMTALVDDYLMPEAMTEGKRNILNDKPSYDEYGKIKSRMTALASVIKDLAQKYNIVVTALVEEEKDENTGTLIGKPMITGKYRDKMQADYDETYYLTATKPLTGPMEYKLYAQPFQWYRAKSRLTTLTSLINPDYSKIRAAFKKIPTGV